MKQKAMRFQFSLLSVLALITASAAVLAFLRSLELPVLAQFVFAVYAILLLSYFVLRGFFLLRRSRALRNEVLSNREELSHWVETRRQTCRADVEDEEPTSSETDERL